MIRKFRNSVPFAFGLASACGMAVACAADPGDPAKIISQGSASAGSSGTGSGSPTTFTVSGSGTGSASGSASLSGTGSGAASLSGSTSGSSALDASTGGTADATLPPATPLEVDYFTVDAPPVTAKTQIQFDLQVVNTDSSATVSLSEVTLRYWFTSDSNAVSDLYFQSYYAQNKTTSASITGAVAGIFVAAPTANVTSLSDTYLEVSFTADAASLPPGEAATVQVDIRGPGATGYSDVFNETNDYSFDATKTVVPAAWPNVTAYIGGQLVWGVEPGSGATAGTPDASVGDAASDGTVGQGSSTDAASGQETGGSIVDSAPDALDARRSD